MWVKICCRGTLKNMKKNMNEILWFLAIYYFVVSGYSFIWLLWDEWMLRVHTIVGLKVKCKSLKKLLCLKKLKSNFLKQIRFLNLLLKNLNIFSTFYLKFMTSRIDNASAWLHFRPIFTTFWWHFHLARFPSMTSTPTQWSIKSSPCHAMLPCFCLSLREF